MLELGIRSPVDLKDKTGIQVLINGIEHPFLIALRSNSFECLLHRSVSYLYMVFHDSLSVRGVSHIEEPRGTNKLI